MFQNKNLRTYLGSHEEDVVLDVMDTGGDDGQSYTWEDVGIVTLTWVVSFAFVSDGQERRAAGEDGLSLNN